jgi:superfamily II RNA helicase
LRAEDALEIDEPTKEADFKVAGPAWLWAQGESFDELSKVTTASPGDLIRYFRMTIQLLRQVESSLPREDPLRRRLRGCVARMNRGEVDAERQLRMGIRPTANESAESRASGAEGDEEE